MKTWMISGYRKILESSFVKSVFRENIKNPGRIDCTGITFSYTSTQLIFLYAQTLNISIQDTQNSTKSE